jgi:4-amino-4-deoxy-L-arabinose transferase-like glycosyltransferase
MRSSAWLGVMVLLALIAAAAVLRAIGLNDGLWFDEIITLVLFVRPPLERIVTEYPNSNNHPLYSILAHLSVTAFGEQPWALRLPAAIFGVAAVPAVYALGRLVTGRRESLLAAGLITVSYHHIWFSQNARGYTALALCAVACSWLLLRAWRSGQAKYFVLYGIVAALGVYTHLTLALMVVGHAVVMLAEGWWTGVDRRRAILATAGLAIAAVGSMALYAPMAGAVYAFFSGPSPQAAAVATPAWAVREMLKGLRLGLGASGALSAAVLFAAGLWSFWKQDRFATALFVLPGLTTAAALVVGHSPIRPRFFFFLSGFAVLFVVRGTTVAAAALGEALPAPARAYRTALATGAILLIVVASLASLPRGYRYPKQDYEGAMHFVDSIATARTQVLTAGLAVYPYREYYGRAWHPVQTERDLRSLQHAGGDVILVYTFPEYTDAGLMRVVTDSCRPMRVFPATVAGGDIVVCAIPPLRAEKHQ